MVGRGLFLMALGLVIGCGSGSDLSRRIVVGKVSLQGQPITDGMIQFVPVKGTKGPIAAAEIKDGAYRVAAGGGVPLGTHRVEILAFRTVAKSVTRAPSMQELPTKQQYLPAKYNHKSTMEVSIAGKDMSPQNFDLK